MGCRHANPAAAHYSRRYVWSGPGLGGHRASRTISQSARWPTSSAYLMAQRSAVYSQFFWERAHSASCFRPPHRSGSGTVHRRDVNNRISIQLTHVPNDCRRLLDAIPSQSTSSSLVVDIAATDIESWRYLADLQTLSNGYIKGQAYAYCIVQILLDNSSVPVIVERNIGVLGSAFMFEAEAKLGAFNLSRRFVRTCAFK